MSFLLLLSSLLRFILDIIKIEVLEVEYLDLQIWMTINISGMTSATSTISMYQSYPMFLYEYIYIYIFQNVLLK